ncbi:HAD family hydrolase [Paenibacillus sp. Y412MC10]|uniref:HAD family hydrolase n=1 Tax=Geobacillus sp. (strain Y412MC10) TaxID=481743 RepID=UPI0011A37CCC|nr:HAD family hydrolase [Paenibacillus sp. Y412MC10]
MRYKHLLFDLDGTITDPKIGITKSVQYALNKFGIQEDDLDKLEPFIGPPLKNSFMEIYSFSEDQALQGVEYYREYFRERGIFENELYPGMQSVLKQLQDDGFTLYVATSKPKVFADEILKYFGVDLYFEWVVGSHLDGTLSDKTEIITYILQNRNLVKSKVVMIGDRKHDMIGAKNNGIDSIGAEYGYGSDGELLRENCTYYIKKIEDILGIVY